jgi:hypothetical protein
MEHASHGKVSLVSGRPFQLESKAEAATDTGRSDQPSVESPPVPDGG